MTVIDEEVFIENAEDNVDHKNCDEEKKREIGKRGFENIGGSLDLSCDSGWECFMGQILDFRDGRA
jgi:hypothetical protein